MDTQPQENTDSRHPIIKWIDKYKLALAGFFGWYIVSGMMLSSVGALSMCAFPINIMLLLVAGRVKSLRQLGFGILTALALNFLISLFVGVFINGICFIPFYVKN